MKKRSAVILGAGLAILLAAIVFAVLVSRERLRRHRVFRAGEERAATPRAIPPVEQWSDTFQRLDPGDLDELLESISKKHPDLYGRWSLGYLHARALIEENELSDAEAKLRPFLQAGHPFRNLALYHQAEIEEARNHHDRASALRQELVFSDGTVYRAQAIEEEAEFLASKNPAELKEFLRKLTPSLDTKERRDLNARVIEAEVRSGNTANAFALLKAGTTDDAADRVSHALDRPDLIAKMTAEQRALLGETFQDHRRFERAIALLSSIPLND